MPRLPRILYQNAYYHVMNRGAGKCDIFHNDNHKKMFLSLLEEVTDLFNAEIIAFCLMVNHYHLLIRTPDANLPEIMQRIDGLYTKRLNYLLERDGPIFRGRYKAIIIENDAYLFHVSCYIHLNPLKSNLVKKPEEYPWSSYQFYINKYSYYPWLHPEIILELIGENNPKERYKNYVENNIIRKRNWENLDDLNYNKPTINAIIDAVSEYYQVPTQSIAEVNKKNKTRNIPKLVFVKLCQSAFGYPYKKIAEEIKTLNIESLKTLSSRNKTFFDNNKQIKIEYNKLKNQLMQLLVSDTKSYIT